MYKDREIVSRHWLLEQPRPRKKNYLRDNKENRKTGDYCRWRDAILFRHRSRICSRSKEDSMLSQSLRQTNSGGSMQQSCSMSGEGIRRSSTGSSKKGAVAGQSLLHSIFRAQLIGPSTIKRTGEAQTGSESSGACDYVQRCAFVANHTFASLVRSTNEKRLQ